MLSLVPRLSAWRYPHSQLGRVLLVSSDICSSAADQPQAAAAVDRWDRQTDGRTDGRTPELGTFRVLGEHDNHYAMKSVAGFDVVEETRGRGWIREGGNDKSRERDADNTMEF